MTLADRPLLARLTLKSIQELSDSYLQMQCRYQSAIREVRTKLENLDEEFQLRHKRNPIHHMQSRLKTVQSITEKLQRRNLPVSFASAAENLYDIAGIRVICSYISDIYTVADLLKNQDDIVLIKEQDYITNPQEKRVQKFASCGAGARVPCGGKGLGAGGGTNPFHRHGPVGKPGPSAALQGAPAHPQGAFGGAIAHRQRYGGD